MSLLKFKYIRVYLVLYLSLNFFLINAQDPDIFTFGELRVDDPFDNITYQVETINNSYLFINRHWDINLQAYRFSFIKTDLDFNEIDRIDTLGVYEEFGAVYINVINDSENNLVLNRFEYIDDVFVYSTQLLDLTSLEINPVDSIVMPIGEEISYNRPINAVHNKPYERFGIIKSSRGAVVYGNCYIEILPDGIIDIQYINLTEPFKAPLLHLYIDELNSYFIPNDYDDYVVMDDNFKFQYTVSGETIYEKGDTTFYAPLNTCFCRFQEDKIHVFGRTFFSTSNYAFLHATLPVNDGKIEQFDENRPLFDVPNFKGRIAVVACLEDSQGNVIVAIDDNTNMYPYNMEDNIYIQKVNKDYENEWFIGFNNGAAFNLMNHAIDKNDDIVIVGQYIREDIAPEVHNFYLKVSTDGLISATHGAIPEGMFILYPNPAVESVSLEGPTESIHSYMIYDTQGRKVKSFPFTEGNNINLDGLNPGTYFLHFLSKNGELINSSKLIKY